MGEDERMDQLEEDDNDSGQDTEGADVEEGSLELSPKKKGEHTALTTHSEDIEDRNVISIGQTGLSQVNLL